MARRAPPPPALVAIVGATATGKSALAMALARHLPAEILVADSRQVRHGMAIGTAAPTAAERAAVPHHLLDLAAPDAPFTVADWVARARALLPEIAARGQLPLLVGGSGLYVSSLLDGYDLAAQAWSAEVGERLRREWREAGLAPLVARLAALDPRAAERIDRHNPRRVLRALERAELAGGAADPPRAAPYPGPVVQLALARPREALYRRIDARAATLFDSGLLDEVRGLLAAGVDPDLPVFGSHGYREAIRHLRGEWTLDEAVAITARRTRQYAKRQLTWFRRDPRVVWLPAGDAPGDDDALVAQALSTIRAALGASGGGRS